MCSGKLILIISLNLERMINYSAALSSATQYAMPPEFGIKWRTVCLNTMFPLPTLLCAGCSVKLFLKKNIVSFLTSQHFSRIRRVQRKFNMFFSPLSPLIKTIFKWYNIEIIYRRQTTVIVIV